MKYPRRQGLKKLSATHIVGKRRRVWSCRGCGMIANAKPTQCASCGRLDFISWDSAGEQKRWATLTLLEKAGEISNLQRQITFDLYAWNEDKRQPVKVGRYIADFAYDDHGEHIVEDFKGAITDLASWKLRHLEAQGIKVKIST